MKIKIPENLRLINLPPKIELTVFLTILELKNVKFTNDLNNKGIERFKIAQKFGTNPLGTVEQQVLNPVAVAQTVASTMPKLSTCSCKTVWFHLQPLDHPIYYKEFCNSKNQGTVKPCTLRHSLAAYLLEDGESLRH